MEKRILIDLDAILDTRLGIINKLQPELLERVAESSEYRLRKRDSFDWVPGLQSSKLIDAWKNRDSELLPYSTMSLLMAVELTNHLLEWDEIIMGNSPTVSKVSILVNMHPYDDLPDEVKDKICYAIALRLGVNDPSDVKAVTWATESISLKELEKNSVVSYFVYDFDNWISHLYPDDENIDYEKTGFETYHDLSVIAPKLYTDAKDLDEVLNESHPDIGKLDPFNATIQCFAPCFQLDFIPSVLYTRMDKYSLDILEKRKKESQMKRLFDAEVTATIDRMFNHEEDPAVVFSNRLDSIEHEVGLLRVALENKDALEARKCTVRLRRWLGTISNLLPGSHTADFQKYIDSVESYFDLDEASAKETVEYWSDKGVKASTITKQVNRETIYACVLLEPYEDKAVGDVIPSKRFREAEFDAVFTEGDTLWGLNP